jgi:hypothetical protein
MEHSNNNNNNNNDNNATPIFTRLKYRTTGKTIILPVVLYGCETWSLTLREEQRQFENIVARRIFGPMRDEVTGGFSKMHNEVLHNLYPS